jgi:hypothetical protein
MKRNMWKRIFLVVLCGLLMAAPAFSAGAEGESETEQSWQLTGQVGGTTKAICREGSTLYVGSGLHVLALDVSDPKKMSLIGTSPLLPQFVESLVSDGNGRLYACCGDGGLVILDVSNPAETQILGSLNTLGYTEGVALDGKYAVLADGPLGVQIADISDPANPTFVSSAYSLAYVYAVALQNGIVYAAGGGSGLFTVDLSDPLSPKEAGLLSLDGFQYDVKIANGRLYTAGAWGGVHVLDIASPLSPVKAANAYTPGWAMALAVDGNSLLVLDGADGALLYGIAGVQPVRMSAITLSGYMAAGTLNGTSAFVIDREKGLIAIDYSQKSQPRFISRWMPLMDGRRVAMSGTACYVAGGLSGLHVYDMTSASNPTETYWYDTGGGYANSVILGDGNLYVGSHLQSSEPIIAFSTEEALQPEKLGILKANDAVFNSAVRALALANGYLYIAGEQFDISVDVRDPAHPKVAGTVPLENPINADISGDLLITTNSYETQLINVADPTNMQVYDLMPKNTGGEAIRFIDSKTIITSADPGVWIVDVSDPSNPKKLSELKITGSVMDIHLDGTTAYLTNLGNGVEVVDISDLANPRQVGKIKTLGYAYDCAVNGDMLVVADSIGGLCVYTRGEAAESSTQTTASAPLTLAYGDEPVTFLMPDNSSAPEKTISLVVTSTEDSGEGTLRACLTNLREGTVITFDPAVFPVNKPATIRLQTPLPVVTRSYVTIDASNAGVILDGSDQQEGYGIEVQASHFTVMGLQIYHFPLTGIEVSGDYCKIGGDRNIGTGPVGQGNVSSGNGRYGIRISGWYGVVSGNLTGVDLSGQKAMPNVDGIFVSDWAFHATVGGTKPGESNVISGNEWVNIDSWGDHTRIIGNLIGVDITGTKAISNQTGTNIVMESGVTNNVVGGTTPEERNIISGARCSFVFSDPNSYQCSVIGNYIGTDITGTKAIPGSGGGGPWTSSHHRVGGTKQGEGNLICGGQEGVTLCGYGAEDNIVLGNRIGLSADGSALQNETGLSANMGQIHMVVGGYTAAEGNEIYGGSISMRISDSGIKNAYIAGNKVTNPRGSELFLENGPHNNFVQGNTFGQSQYNPIRIDYGESNLLRANTFSGDRFDQMILLLEGGNASLPAPTVASAAGSAISGTAISFGYVEVYLSENGLVSPLGSTVADKNGNFTFTAAEPLTGKQVLLLVSDALGNTSCFSAAVKAS